MKKIVVFVIAIMLCSLQAFAQKGTTPFGDTFAGHVVKTDDASREITLEYAGKDGTETFVGTLKEGYQLKLKDGSTRELKVSELTHGTRIRVTYKKISKAVSGKKVTTNVISGVQFLGRDEFDVMRRFLKVEPSTPVTLVESKTLPDADPLRLKIVTDNPVSNDEVIKWAKAWNKREAKKYGAISVVSDIDEADVTLVIHKGIEDLAGTVGHMFTIFLVIEKPAGLEVIWKDPVYISFYVAPMPFSVSDDGQIKGLGALIAREIEKRLKFRHKEKQK
jgi:hypothetical protein